MPAFFPGQDKRQDQEEEEEGGCGKGARGRGWPPCICAICTEIISLCLRF